MVLHGHIGPRRLVRTFVAIPTPEDIVRKLQKLTQRFELPGCKVRWSTPEQFHLTVQFLGNVEWIEVGKIGKALKEVAAEFPPITLKLSRLGTFPAQNQPRVIMAALEPAPELLALVQALQTRLQAEFQIVPENRSYRPHVTLGRVKSVADAEAGEALRTELAAVDPELLGSWGEWEADELTFFQSDLQEGRGEYIELSHAALEGGKGDGEEDEDEAEEDLEEEDEEAEHDEGDLTSGAESDDDAEDEDEDEDEGEPAAPGRGARPRKTLGEQVEEALSRGEDDDEEPES